MKTIDSILHCKATAELEDSVIDDMLKTDGSLKDLLHDDKSEDRSSNDQSTNSDRGDRE